MQEWTEVFGRLVFTTQAVEHVKPLLGPWMVWTAAVRSGALVELPLRVRLILKLLIKIAWNVSRSRVEVSIAIVFKERRTFRANARAEGDHGRRRLGNDSLSQHEGCSLVQNGSGEESRTGASHPSS
jgi:hypothetical protein